MPSFDNLMLAQANAPPVQVTDGQVLAILLLLFTTAFSLAMIVLWVLRIGQTGHAIPAAQRGILRVPVTLTLVAIGLSLLILSMTTTQSIDEFGGTSAMSVDEENSGKLPDSERLPGAAGESVDSPDASSGVNADAPNRESQIPNPETSAAPMMTPDKVMQTLIDNLVVNLIVFVVLGIVVLSSRRFGRHWLPDGGIIAHSTGSGADRIASDAFLPHGSWPDLDDSSAMRESPEDFVRGAETNPFAWTSTPSTTPTDISRQAIVSADPALAEERFSFLTELRYAAEVFLAAYAPTTILRLSVVVIMENILGKQARQHPFLDMLDSGSGYGIIALIVFTAVVVAPLLEELQYRVVILGGMVHFCRPLPALILASILFAFAHGFPDSLALLPLAAALGYAYLRRRSYVTVVLVHFLFNGFNMAIALIAMM